MTLDQKTQPTCEDCGGPVLVWFAPNALWNLVKGGPDASDDPGGVLCPNCFIKRAEAAGISPTAWVVSQENLPDALPPPEGDAGELVERLKRQADIHEAWEYWELGQEPVPDAMHYIECAELLREAAKTLSRQLPAPTGEVVAFQPGERALAKKWMTTLLTKLGTKPEHIDDCMWLQRMIMLVDAAPVVASAKAGWVLVVSTDEMHQAYTKAKYEGPKPTLIPDLWAAMLAAAPQSPMGEGTVGVKPLEWFREEGTDIWRAPSMLGRYTIVPGIPVKSVNLPIKWWGPEPVNTWFDADTLDEAKAAAQADYETRILSALSPSRQGTGK